MDALGWRGSWVWGAGGLSLLADGCKAPFHPLLKERKVRGLNNAHTMGPHLCFCKGKTQENQDGKMELDLRIIIVRISSIRIRQRPCLCENGGKASRGLLECKTKSHFY